MISTGAGTEDESKRRIAQRARARKIRQRRRRIREQGTVQNKDSDVYASEKSIKNVPVRRSKRLREEERNRVCYSSAEQNAQPNGQPANDTLEWDEPPCKKHRLSKLEEESAKELEKIDGIGPSLANILVKSNLLGVGKPTSLDALAKWVQEGKENQDALLRFFRSSESIPKETKKWEGWNTRTAPKILKKLLEYEKKG